MGLGKLHNLAIAGLALGIGGGVSAQDLGGFYSGMAMNGLTSNQINITQRAVGRNVGQELRGGGAGEAETRGAARAAPRLSFNASPAVRRRNYEQFVARSRAVDPAGAAGLAETLRSDPVALMAPDLARYGLRADNLADAYTVYWIEAWEAAHGVTGENSRATVQAVKSQATNAMLATPEVATATDAQKQEFAEALLVQALLIGASREQAKGDQKTLDQIVGAVRQGARASGLDLDAMVLTEEGFVPAKRTGAAVPSSDAPNGAPGAPARADLAGSGSYAWLALAGGAGLGAAFLFGKLSSRKG